MKHGIVFNDSLPIVAILEWACQQACIASELQLTTDLATSGPEIDMLKRMTTMEAHVRNVAKCKVRSSS